MIELRQRLADEAWIELVNSPTRVFVERYHELTGADLRG
jgi:hypothetical protein